MKKTIIILLVVLAISQVAVAIQMQTDLMVSAEKLDSSELWNDDRHYSKRKWYISDDTGYLTSFLNIRQEMITETRWKFYWEFYPFIASNEFLSDWNLTITEKALSALKSKGQERQRHFTELRDYWFNMPEEPIGHIIGDLTYLSKEGMPKLVITHGILQFKETEFDSETLSGSFILDMTQWQDGEKFKIGFKSQTYTSGTITVEYVENLGVPQLTSTLASGGTLASGQSYIISVHAMDSETSRMKCNYTRSMNWTVFVANSTHGSVNVTWAEITNASLYWVKMSKGDDPTDIYYRWSSEINSTGYITNGYGNAQGYYSGYASGTFWLFQNSSTYAKVNYRWDDETHTEGSDHDLNVPMFRVWGSAQQEFFDVWQASETMGWGNINRTVEYDPKWVSDQYTSDYIVKSTYMLNASFQTGSQWGTGYFLTRNEQISIQEHLFIYSGSFRAGDSTWGYGSQIAIKVPYRSNFKGQITVESGAVLQLFDSHLMWAMPYRSHYAYGIRMISYGSLNMKHTTLSSFGLSALDGDLSLEDVLIIRAWELRMDISPTLFDDVTIENSQYGVYTKAGGALSGLKTKGNSYDLYLNHYNSQPLNITNSELDYTRFMLYYPNLFDTAFHKFTVNLKVTYDNGTSVDNATVIFTSSNRPKYYYDPPASPVWEENEGTTIVFSGATNSSGMIDTQTLIYRHISRNVTTMGDFYHYTDYGPYNLTITKDGLETYQCIANITEQTDWTIALLDEIVTETDPIARFCFTPSNPRPQQIVSFDGTESTDADGGSIANYTWSFGDGASDDGNTTTHFYTTDGDYNVTLTVTDDEGATDSFSQTVTVLLGGRSTRIPKILTVSLNPIEPPEPSLMDVWWWKTTNAKGYVTVTSLLGIRQDVQITWWLTYRTHNSTVLASGNRTLQLDPTFYPTITATIPFTIPLNEGIVPRLDETYSFHATVTVMQQGIGQQTSEEICMPFALSSSTINTHLTILVVAVIVGIIALLVAIQRLRPKKPEYPF